MASNKPIYTDTLVIGTGFSGLGMGIELLRRNRKNFIILEKADEVGGTWRDNTYPGCACDIPSWLYSFSFEKNDWSRSFSPQPEIFDYLKHVAAKHDLYDHIHFGVQVDRAEWDDDASLWFVYTTDGQEYSCRYLVSGIGALHIPSIPSIRGRQDFKGTQFHSAQWDETVDLNGKRVAIIGTGASSIQIVPKIIDQVSELQLYQRTPAWILPRPNPELPQSLRSAIYKVPGAYRILRWVVYWLQEILGYAMTRQPHMLWPVERLAKWHLNRTVKDPILRAKLLPDFQAGCKRLLNDIYGFYAALTQQKSEVITDGITSITPSGIVTSDGKVRQVDVIVWATGFHVTDSYLYFDILGLHGTSLIAQWNREGVSAHRGITVANMPNLFFLLGPNTGLGHNSVVAMIEPQIRYIAKAMRSVDRSRAQALIPKPESQQQYNEELQERLGSSVWNTGGCKSWYMDEHGINRTLWSGTVTDYWSSLRKFRRSEYRYLQAK